MNTVSWIFLAIVVIGIVGVFFYINRKNSDLARQKRITLEEASLRRDAEIKLAHEQLKSSRLEKEASLAKLTPNQLVDRTGSALESRLSRTDGGRDASDPDSE